jgi:DNA mismatch repair protein MutS
VEKIQIGNITVNVADITFKPNPIGITKITVPEIDTNSDDIVNIQKNIYKTINNYFLYDVNKIVEKYGSVIKNIINFISKFDYYVSNAKTSSLYKYTRPIIDNRSYSYVVCKQLRHPIIERLIDYEYIAHDVSLGKDLKGILLYGLNSSGKSSMMKALGISVIMAQAGMFVPASEFTYSPYTSLFTRISGNDNIFKELSSFSVEMIELKAIWKRSDMRTLIIGDEVCRGTEHISGNSIVAATLIKLSQQKASFIFATHLHEIVRLPQIQSIKNIKAFHLSVSYDDKNDRLVFDRLLKEGSGEEIYGITVAKYIIQDNEFTEMANNIKNELLGISDNIIQPKVSKYNSSVYVNKCATCGKQLNVKDDVVNLDTHHIHYQKDCADGVVGDKKFIKKNSKSNLIVLCKKCHNQVHNGKLSIDKYVASTSGKILKHGESF